MHRSASLDQRFQVEITLSKKILVLPGDGIGPEIVAEAVKVLATLRDGFGLDIDMERGPGGRRGL